VGTTRTSTPLPIPGETAPAAPSPEAVFSLLLDLDGGGIDASVLCGGRRVVHALQAPAALASFLPGAADPLVENREKLRRHFQAHGNAWPASVRIGRKVVPVQWEGYSARGTRTEADLVDDRLLVLRHRIATGYGIRNPPMVRDGFWFDLRGGVFGLLPRDAGWRNWHRARRHLNAKGIHPKVEDVPGREATYLVSDLEIHGIPTGDDHLSEETSLQLCVGGRPVIAESLVPEYALSIRPSGNARTPWLLRGEVRFEGRHLPLASELLRIFRPAGIPLAVRRVGGEDGWYESLIGAIGAEGGAISEREIPRAASEAAELLRDGTAMAFPLDARWVSFRTDPVRQARLLEIPFRIFGSRAFTGSHDPGEMRIAGTEVSARLHDLLAAANSAGITLSYGDGEVSEAGVEVSVEAVRGDFDWFEVRPEISLDGETLDEETWGDVLLRDGFVIRGGQVLVLDPAMRDVLKAVAASMRRGKRGERGRIVRIPRLAILDLLDLRRHGVRIVLSEGDRLILDRLARLVAVPRMPVPSGLRATLRQYQSEGLDWLSFLYENRLGACLADDMGLGKTVQAIAFLASIKEGIVKSRMPGQPSLIVMPPSLLFNWESEIARFYPGFRVATYRGKGRVADFGEADLVLTTYDIVRRDIGLLSEMTFDVIVFDEAQTVKNLFAKSTGAARKLRSAFSMALTGTPVENHLGEYFSILDLVVPGILGDYDDVRRRLRKDDASFLDVVRRRSRPFVLRRAKETILPELPPKSESDMFLELSDRQKTLYRRAADSAKEEVERAYKTRTEGRARVIALTAILRLRQLCLSPELLFPSRREVAPKIDFLLSRLEELRDEGHSVLVFSQFTTYLDLVDRAMAEHGMTAMRLDGTTPVPERKRRVEAFQGGDAPSVFLLSLKAGGKGLNLVKASYVILLDPWWNPAVERQAADRAHRIGQERKVSVLRLLMRHTVEEKMVALSARKSGLYKALLGEPGAAVGAALSREDFAFLLG
jgi:non-specific serine/threonine protein kinase